MRIALIASMAWIDEEMTLLRQLLPLLERLEVDVTAVLPHQPSDQEPWEWNEILPWEDSPWDAVRCRRLGALAGLLKDKPPEVLHAADGRVWAGALKLAGKLNVPLVLSAHGMQDLLLMERLLPLVHGNPAPVAFAAASEPLAAAMREIIGRDGLVDLIRPGVSQALSPAVPSQADAQGPMCVAVSGLGLLDPDGQAWLQAMQTIVREFPAIQFFLDIMGQDPHPLWQEARRFDLLANLSLVPRKLGHRQLLLNADVLVQPQALGRPSQLILQAMARGLPVLARADEWVDFLVDQQTAWLVHEVSHEHWLERLRLALTEPEQARELGRRAKDWVLAGHDLSRQAQALAALYQRLAGVPIKFRLT